MTDKATEYIKAQNGNQVSIFGRLLSINSYSQIWSVWFGGEWYEVEFRNSDHFILGSEVCKKCARFTFENVPEFISRAVIAHNRATGLPKPLKQVEIH